MALVYFLYTFYTSGVIECKFKNLSLKLYFKNILLGVIFFGKPEDRNPFNKLSGFLYFLVDTNHGHNRPESKK